DGRLRRIVTGLRRERPRSRVSRPRPYRYGRSHTFEHGLCAEHRRTHAPASCKGSPSPGASSSRLLGRGSRGHRGPSPGREEWRSTRCSHHALRYEDGMSTLQFLADFRVLHEKAKKGSLTPLEKERYRDARVQFGRMVVIAQQLGHSGQTLRSTLRMSKML